MTRGRTKPNLNIRGAQETLPAVLRELEAAWAAERPSLDEKKKAQDREEFYGRVRDLAEALRRAGGQRQTTSVTLVNSGHPLLAKLLSISSEPAILQAQLWVAWLRAQGASETMSATTLAGFHAIIGYASGGDSAKQLLSKTQESFCSFLRTSRRAWLWESDVKGPPAKESKGASSAQAPGDVPSWSDEPVRLFTAEVRASVGDDLLDFLPAHVVAQVRSLAEAIQPPGSAALLVGPAAAGWSGLPDDQELAERIGRKTGFKGDLAAVCQSVSLFHKDENYARLYLAEMMADDRCPVGDRYQIIARAPFAFYATLNPDRHLEWALADARRRPAVVALHPEEAVIPWGHVPVLKLAGSVAHPHTLRLPGRTPDPTFSRLMQPVQTLVAVGFEGHAALLTAVCDIVAQSARERVVAVEIGARTAVEMDSNRVVVRDTVELTKVLIRLAELTSTQAKSFAARSLSRENPFPGLLPYADGSGAFLGREADVDRIHGSLGALPPVTTFFGASGCGKSSLFAAGVRPHAERRGLCCVLTRLAPNMLPEEQILAALGQKGPEPTVESVVRALHVSSKGEVAVVILDQFEQIFYPPFTAPERERVLREVLPALARALGDRARFILIVRSDDLHHLDTYRGVPELAGVFHEARRVDALSRASSEAVIRDLFAQKGYALDPTCVAAIAAEATAPFSDRPYLPYVQLLGGRFFEFLEARHVHARGFDQPITVSRDDFAEFVDRGALFSDFLRSTVVELLQVEGDRALLFRVFDLLIEGHRRRPLSPERIARSFAEPERVGRLLVNLASRRLIRFDEDLGGFELVHDALVEPLRAYVDDHRSDFSHSELVAAARRILRGEIVSSALLANIALHCLRDRLPVAWLDQVLPDATAFYASLLDRCLPEEQPLVWQQLARACERRKRPPPGFVAEDLLEALVTARNEETAVSAAQLLQFFALDVDQARRLAAWLEEGDATGASPLARGWTSALARVEEVVFRVPGFDPLSLFHGKHIQLLGETTTWEPYFRLILEGVVQGTIDVTRAARRFREALAPGMDIEVLRGAAGAMLVFKECPVGFEDAVQITIKELSRHRHDWVAFLIVRLCRILLRRMHGIAQLHLSALLGDLARSDVAMDAARVLGLSLQDRESWAMIARRFAAVREPEYKALLFEALIWSPADLPDDNAFSASIPDGEARRTIPALHEKNIRALAEALEPDDFAERAPSLLASFGEDGAPLLAYVTARELANLEEESSLVRLDRLRRVLCAWIAREAMAIVPAEARAPLLTIRPESGDFYGEWEQAEVVIQGFPADFAKVGEDAQAMLRWLRLHLATSKAPALVALRAHLDTWLAEVPDIARALARPPAPTYRLEIARSPALAAIRAALAAPRVKSLLLALPVPDTEITLTLEGVDALARVDHARTVAHRLVLSAEITGWMVKRTRQELWDDAEAFLGWLLTHPPCVTSPGQTQGQLLEAVIDALVHVFKGSEARLVASLPGRVLDPDVEIQVLIAIMRVAPAAAGSALQEVVVRVLGSPERGGFIQSILDALIALALGPASPDRISFLRQVATSAESRPVRGAAIRTLVRLSSDPEILLFALEVAQQHPDLRRSIAEAISSGSN